LTGKRVKTLYGPLRRFERESDRGMSEKGQCEKETESKLKKYVQWRISFKEWSQEMVIKDQLLSHILLEQAKRIDKQEERLILLENWAYKSGCK
jgi:uncharacterized protein YaaW (UPF0174 family)